MLRGRSERKDVERQGDDENELEHEGNISAHGKGSLLVRK